VYDGEIDGYIYIIKLIKSRYIATHRTSEKADGYIDNLRDMGVVEYDSNNHWESASDPEATYSPSIGDVYAVAAAKDFETNDEGGVTLLVGADDDYMPSRTNWDSNTSSNPFETSPLEANLLFH